MKALDLTALILVIVGGINWLLVGLFQFDLVATLFGGQTAIISKIVYILVGLSALYSLKFIAPKTTHVTTIVNFLHYDFTESVH